MSGQESTSEYAWPPSVVGFDMPSSIPSAPGQSEPVMVAFLNTPPDHFWIEAFVSEVEHFKTEHDLRDLRIDARRLVVKGDVPQLRGLSTNLRNFVHRVSRISLQRRVLERMRSTDVDSPEFAANIAAVHDVDLIARIPAIAAILEEVSRDTGMRFATVARVSDTRWTACAVYDTIDFGLRAGQDLVLETTICNEIREHGRAVMFSHASAHPIYSQHPTPALYGFESYVSVPIHRADGEFFGTLCAVDPQPRVLDAATLKAMERHALAIAEQLDATLG